MAETNEMAFDYQVNWRTSTDTTKADAPRIADLLVRAFSVVLLLNLVFDIVISSFAKFVLCCIASNVGFEGKSLPLSAEY